MQPAKTTKQVQLPELVADIANALVAIDGSGIPFRKFRPGVGPYGEPQLVRLIAERLNNDSKYGGMVRTKRTPDLLIPQEWALEFKIARPFGDNAKEAENWSVNLLHPYAGNVSSLGDCQKLANWSGPERRAAVVVGYEHESPQISLDPLVSSFEVIAQHVLHLRLSERVQARREGLMHPVHQALRVFAWEILCNIGND